MSDLVDQVATAILSETPANYVTQNIAQAHRNAEIALTIIEPAIRADEREKIAAAIEAERDRQKRLAEAIHVPRDRYVALATLAAFDAARIARGGSDA